MRRLGHDAAAPMAPKAPKRLSPAPKTKSSRIKSINEITVPAMAKPRGSLNKPTMLNMAPKSHIIQPSIGTNPMNKPIRARTNPAIPIPLLLLLPA